VKFSRTIPRSPEKPQKCNPSVLLSHPTGNQNVRNALRSLVEHDMLAEFWTTVAWNPQSRWNRLLPSGVRAQLSRRAYEHAPKKQLRLVPFRECVRLGASFSMLQRFLTSGERPFSIIGIYGQFDKRVATRIKQINVNTVYVYEGCALQTLREAKRHSVKALYELPSSFWYWEHKLLSEEAELNPTFATLLPKLRDSADFMERKDEELQLADYVFVPSRHVQRTLENVFPAERIRVVNYGAPPIRRKKEDSFDRSRPLKVLFVGALTQRKGIGYLLEAIDMLGSQVELTIVGKRFLPNPRVDEACNRWRWFETLPNSRVLDLMQEADVLVLPSLAEGSALVVPEALACGLPVVVTPNTGSEEFVIDGLEGYVVPIRSAGAIADRLNHLNRDRELLAEMSRRAHATAARKSWDNYRNEWADVVRSVS
jgi:starch synthase